MKFIKKKTELLSNYPSKAILQALDDLETLEKHPNYEINMNSWHHVSNNGKCHVCLAGSVLACRPSSEKFGEYASYAPNTLVDKGPYSTDAENELYANQVGSFDYLRENYIEDFLYYWIKALSLYELEELANRIKDSAEKVAPYYEYRCSPVGFKKWLKAVSKALKEEGY